MLDAFVVREPGSLDHPTCVESRDPCHDNRAVLVGIGPMPELEALLAPVRLKLEALKEPEQRRTYVERAKAWTMPRPQETRPARSTASRACSASYFRWLKPR